MSDSNYGTIVDSDKVDIRRFCGYPAYGASVDGFLGWRFFQAEGLMEYRLNNMSVNECAVIQNYLTTLRTLEAAIPNAAALLAIEQAAVFKHNKNEVRDRTRLYEDWRKRLCAFIGIPPGDYLDAGGFAVVI